MNLFSAEVENERRTSATKQAFGCRETG